MGALPNRALAEAERKLTVLLMEIRGTAPFERVKLYVAKFTAGRLLSDYLHDESVAPKERAALATALIEILLTKDYSRLPVLAVMQNTNVAPIVPRSEIPPEALRPAEMTPQEINPQDETPALDEIRAMVRSEVRRELANIFDVAARVLRET